MLSRIYFIFYYVKMSEDYLDTYVIPKKRDSLVIGDYNGFQTFTEENEIIEATHIEEEKNDNIKLDILTKVFDNINCIFDEVKNTKNNYNEIYKNLQTLKKDYLRIVNQSKKNENKNNIKKSKLQSGFTKPRPISNELCDFLKIERGTLMGRNLVTTEINNYIVTNNLRDPTDRRIIIPNDELKKLLDIENSDIILSYFNIQTFIKHHFI